jgi:hypothetical protein
MGVEHALRPWAWLRCRRLTNVQIHFDNFRANPFGGCSLVHAFRAPAPVQRLSLKTRAEMKADARLVSKSFIIPDIRPESTVEVADRRGTCPCLYRPAG